MGRWAGGSFFLGACGETEPVQRSRYTFDSCQLPRRFALCHRTFCIVQWKAPAYQYRDNKWRRNIVSLFFRSKECPEFYSVFGGWQIISDFRVTVSFQISYSVHFRLTVAHAQASLKSGWKIIWDDRHGVLSDQQGSSQANRGSSKTCRWLTEIDWKKNIAKILSFQCSYLVWQVSHLLSPQGLTTNIVYKLTYKVGQTREHSKDAEWWSQAADNTALPGRHVAFSDW